MVRGSQLVVVKGPNAVGSASNAATALAPPTILDDRVAAGLFVVAHEVRQLVAAAAADGPKQGTVAVATPRAESSAASMAGQADNC